VFIVDGPLQGPQSTQIVAPAESVGEPPLNVDGDPMPVTNPAAVLQRHVPGARCARGENTASSIMAPTRHPLEVRNNHHPADDPTHPGWLPLSPGSLDRSPARRAQSHPRRDESGGRSRRSLIAALPPGRLALPRPLVGTEPRRMVERSHRRTCDRRVRRSSGEHDTRGRRSAARRGHPRRSWHHRTKVNAGEYSRHTAAVRGPPGHPVDAAG